jgi:hypothetical protein
MDPNSRAPTRTHQIAHLIDRDLKVVVHDKRVVHAAVLSELDLDLRLGKAPLDRSLILASARVKTLE